MSTKRAFLEARVSSDGQSDNTSLQNQLDTMRKYCMQRGYEIVEEFSDSHTGTDNDRPALQRARELAKNKQIDVLVYYSVDRFMRNFQRAVITEMEFERLGVKVEYVNLPSEDDDNIGYRIAKNVMLLIAQEEKNIIVDRLNKGKYASVRNGRKVITTYPPYGYDFNEDRTNFVINTEQAETIKRMFELYIKGSSSRDIAAIFTSEKIPTFRDMHPNNSKKKGFGEWAQHVIIQTLQNETYAGIFTLQGKDKATINVPPIVSEETFLLAQKAIEDRKNTRKRSNIHHFLLRGMLFCGECGRPMAIRYTKFADNDKAYKYYICPTVKSPRDFSEKCSLPHINAETVDNIVMQWVYDELPNRLRLIADYKRYYEQKTQSVQNDERLKIIDDLMKKHTAKKQREMDLYRNGFTTIDELKENTAKVDSDIASLERERLSITSSQENILTVNQFEIAIGKLKQIIDNIRSGGDFEELRGFLQKVLELRGVIESARNVETNQIELLLSLEANVLGEASFSLLTEQSRQSFQKRQNFIVRKTFKL